MSATTSTVHGSQLVIGEDAFFEPAKAASDSRSADSVNYDMTPRMRMIVYLSLGSGVVFLAMLASYVWYGFYQWQKIW